MVKNYPSNRVIQAPQIFIGYLMMQILTATFWPVLNSSTLKNRRFDPFKFLKKLFTTFFLSSGRRIWTYFESTLALTKHYNRVTTDLEVISFISIQTDCWKTVSSSSRSKITFTNIVRLIICSLNMILESGACLDVRFNDWTQVILSSRRQGIPMTFLSRLWINYDGSIRSSRTLGMSQ